MFLQRPSYSLIFFLLILGFSVLKATGFRHWTMLDGLPSDRVYCMIQDREGFIWLGTDAGVSRFDGRQFTNFDFRSGLPGIDVINIVEDQEGRIWFLTYEGKLAFFHKGIISNAQNTPWLSHIKNDSPILKFYLAKNGNLWLNTNNNGIISIQGDSVIDLTGKNGFPIISTGHFWEDEDGRIWKNDYSGQWASLPEHNLEFFPFSFCKIGSGGVSTQPNGRTAFFVCANIFQQLSFWGNGKTTTTSLFPAPTSMIVNTLVQESDSSFWACTKNMGLRHFQRNRGVWAEDRIFLPRENISNVLVDRQGKTWISTLNNGLFRESNLQFSESRGNSPLLPGQSKRVLTNGTLTFEKNVVTLHSAEGKAVVFQWKPEFANVIFINDYFISGNGREFMASNWGLSEVVNGNPKSLLDQYPQLKGQRIKQVITDEKGTIWLGTVSGIKTIRDGKVNSISPEFPGLQNQISCLQADPLGGIWVGTVGFGVFRIKDDKISRWNQENGLASNFVNHISSPDSDLVWVSTHRGLAGINRANESLQWQFGTENGFEVPKINRSFSRNDTLFVEAGKKIYFLFPTPRNNEETALSIAFTKMSVGKRDTLLQGEYNFPWLHPPIEIHYSTLQFDGKSTIQGYRIPGLQEKWKQQKEGIISLSNLPSGTHQIQVAAFQPGPGIRSDIQTITLNVKRAPWETLVFWGLVIIVLGLIGLGIGYAVTRRRAMLESRKRELFESKRTALMMQLNPHFIFNSLNSIQRFALENDPIKVAEYVSRFGKLMRSMVDMAEQNLVSVREEIQAMENYLILEQSRMEPGFEYQFSWAEGLSPDAERVPPMILQPILENAIWHGLAHKDEKGNLEIKFEHRNGQLACRISDNGIGRTAAAKRKQKSTKSSSRGVFIVRERLRLSNLLGGTGGRLEYVDLFGAENQPAGTEAILYFSIKTTQK